MALADRPNQPQKFPDSGNEGVTMEQQFTIIKLMGVLEGANKDQLLSWGKEMLKYHYRYINQLDAAFKIKLSDEIKQEHKLTKPPSPPMEF
jgi:hypothetical protein